MPDGVSDNYLIDMGSADHMADELSAREEYAAFLRSKDFSAKPCGFDVPISKINKALRGDGFEFEAAIVRWGLKRGKCAWFEDCGMGKTIQGLEWSKHVVKQTGLPLLSFAPLAVAEQTALEEAPKFGYKVNLCDSQSDIKPGINITNYEKRHKFSPEGLGGIWLDESSILKGMDGTTRKEITEFARGIPFRLCTTATPAPNDHMELGNHAEFLGIMSLAEMLAMFFTHDGGDTSKWRIKGHAQSKFWKWVASWAVAIRKPSDIGYPDGKFVLPKLHMEQVSVTVAPKDLSTLFPVEAITLKERRAARKDSLPARVEACAKLANSIDEPWIIWCDLNAESTALTAAIDGCVEVTGSDADEHKKKSLLGFIKGQIQRMVTKSRIAGFGLNMQRCRRVAFVGMSDSFEQIYQAIRRCLRFGQEREVFCYFIVSEQEGAVVANYWRKEQQWNEMMEGMVEHMKNEMQKNITGLVAEKSEYQRDTKTGNGWTAELGDCVEVVREMPDNSIDFTVYSPPFASLYTYSNSARDMGNGKSHDEFYKHFAFFAGELFRVTKPGRLMSFHCMNLPLTITRDGVIGIRDFRGELIRLFSDAGFIFHSEVCIWKDPVTAMQRTKAIGLLHKQVKKDSCMSRQGIPDYLVTMRKPGVNADPVDGMFTEYFGEEGTGPQGANDATRYSIEVWQRYASPVWMDINPSYTLNRDGAREEADERHVCPLQIQVIERAIDLWTNPGDLVLSPFAGIGSEGYVAVKRGRRAILIELKRSYFDQLLLNMKAAESTQGGLFGTEYGVLYCGAEEIPD